MESSCTLVVARSVPDNRPASWPAARPSQQLQTCNLPSEQPYGCQPVGWGGHHAAPGKRRAPACTKKSNDEIKSAACIYSKQVICRLHRSLEYGLAALFFIASSDLQAGVRASLLLGYY
eukprot:1156081-Pelagomonas_calceolata.AAC.7